MIKKELKIINPSGIHARPASIISKIASKYESDVKIIKDGYEINAKSIMGIMTLAAPQNTLLTFIINGKDENEAFKEMENAFKNGFDE